MFIIHFFLEGSISIWGDIEKNNACDPCYGTDILSYPLTALLELDWWVLEVVVPKAIFKNYPNLTRSCRRVSALSGDDGIIGDLLSVIQ